jgi:uncharacterized membrane protein (UPF0127 family)
VAWLVRDGEVLASTDVAADRAARRKGLLGRETVDGALVLRPCRQVHTFGMHTPIDVVWCDAAGVVLRVTTLRPRRVSTVVWRARFMIEAPPGAAGRWRLEPGQVVELVDGAPGG